MADLVTRLLLNSSNFDNNIVKSTQQIRSLQETGRKASSCMSTFGSTLTKTIMPLASIAGTAMLVSKGLNYAMRTSIDFEKSLSSLRSLTGVTTQELSYFKEEAIRLGSTTTQTASQVVDAFRLIGSQMPVLLQNKEALTQVTEQAILLAEASGMDVPTAAKALTGSLNQMGSSASQASEYVNILAAASQQGAADIPYLNTAIENAGGTAASVGIKYNELVAAVEAIAPKFSDAGSAGTYLRNIFLTLESSADKSLKPSVVGLGTALENLAAKNMDATELTKKFGKINVTAAMAIINSRDEYNKLALSITDTNTAQEQAAINNDNVTGSIKQLSSAWEGFILSLNNSNGTLKSVIDNIRDIIQGWQMALESKEQYYNKQAKDDASVNSKAAVKRMDANVAKGMTRQEAATHEKATLKGLTDYNPKTDDEEIKRLENLKNKYGNLRKEGNDRLVYLKNEKTVYEALVSTIDEYSKKIDVKSNGNNSGGNSISGSKHTTQENKELSPEQSIAYYNQELIKANKEFNSAVSDSARAAIQQKINELKEVIRVMNFQANHPNAPTNLKSENGSMSGHTSLKVKADPGAGLNVQPIYTKADVKTNNEYADSLSGVAQIMNNIQGATNGAAASWLNYATNIMSGVAGMVTAITALSAANEVEQKSATGAAGAEAIKSAAETPIVGWLMVGAAAASVIAAFASLPKFASGGIVGGNSTIGDFNLARVNSGEMILNAGQQANLFNMLNNGNNTTTSQGGKVEFEIRADKLYGVLKNYDLKMGKIR